jgi:hypothetical protein
MAARLMSGESASYGVLQGAGGDYLNPPGARDFSIDTPLYGLDDSERCIEIPWLLSRFRGEPLVLDTGYAKAEPRYPEARDALKIPFLVGLDLAAAP